MVLISQAQFLLIPQAEACRQTNKWTMDESGKILAKSCTFLKAFCLQESKRVVDGGHLGSHHHPSPGNRAKHPRLTPISETYSKKVALSNAASHKK